MNWTIQMKAGQTLLLLLVSCIVCNGQDDESILKNDTLFYKGDKYYKGKVIQFGHSSGGGTEFSFIWLGTGSGLNIAKAPAGYRMMEAEVIKLRKKVWLSDQRNFIEVDMFIGQHLKVHHLRSDFERDKAIPEKYWALSDYSTFTIHLQGAVDAKELLINK